MDKILKENEFKHIESEYQKGFFVKTYRKYRNTKKYIVKIFPGKDFFRIIYQDKMIYTGSINELENTIKSLSLEKKIKDSNFLSNHI